MKPKKRQKICYNCDGEIDLDVIVCTYCAADLREEKPEQQYPAYNSSVKTLGSFSNTQTNQSLYPPAYSAKSEEAPHLEEPSLRETMLPVEEAEEGKNIFGPTVLFTLGVQLFFFGLLMLMFSHEGIVTLRWDATLWFLYLFASVPFLVFGYRALSKL